MATPYNPLDRNASLQELSEAWALRYHYLYKVLRTLKIRPDRGEEGRTRYLTIAQQQQLADVLSARVPRPMDLERRSAEELHADLDRLSQSYERLSQAYEVVAGLAQTYKAHLDWLTPLADERLGRIESLLSLSGSPDFVTSMKAVRTLNDPVGTPLQDVKEGAMFCAAVLGIIARRYEGDEPGYASLVQNFSQQPLGMLRGELIGHLFGLGALLEAALTVHREREDQASVEVLALERTLTQVLGQIKRWANDALPWLGQRVRPLAPEPPAGEETAPAPKYTSKA